MSDLPSSQVLRPRSVVRSFYSGVWSHHLRLNSRLISFCPGSGHPPNNHTSLATD